MKRERKGWWPLGLVLAVLLLVAWRISQTGVTPEPILINAGTHRNIFQADRLAVKVLSAALRAHPKRDVVVEWNLTHAQMPNFPCRLTYDRSRLTLKEKSLHSGWGQTIVYQGTQEKRIHDMARANSKATAAKNGSVVFGKQYDNFWSRTRARLRYFGL